MFKNIYKNYLQNSKIVLSLPLLIRIRVDNFGVRLWALPIVPSIIKADTDCILIISRIMFYINDLIYLMTSFI